MFQTLGYFLELSVSIYFLFVVTLFLINVCEFMPLNSHESVDEEKVYIRTPKKEASSTTKSVSSEPTVGAQKGARKSKSTDKLKPDTSKSTDISTPAHPEEKEEPADKKEESPEQAEEPPTSTEESQNPESAAPEGTDASTAVPNEPEAQVDHTSAEPGEATPSETVEPAEAAPPTETADPAEVTEPATAEVTEPATAEVTEPATAEANATNPEPEANG